MEATTVGQSLLGTVIIMGSWAHAHAPAIAEARQRMAALPSGDWS